MNILKSLTTLRSSFSRLIVTTHNFRWSQRGEKLANKRLVVEPLSERELVRVKGEEAAPFLQGLITNDMNHLQAGGSPVARMPSIYTMFLNKAGRVLFDTIIYRTHEPNTYLIECDRRIATELRQHLRLYLVRRKIEIDSVSGELKPWIVFNPMGVCARQDSVPPILGREMISTPDPRVRDLGTRIIARSDKTWKDLADMFSRSDDIAVAKPTEDCNYRIHRYRYGVGEGVHDLPPGKCFPLEANCDFLHGVSFHKGCYLGQELTARVHHTGVVRKRIMPLRLSVPMPAKMDFPVQTESGAKVGVMRGSHLDRALALMRVEPTTSARKLQVNGQECFAEKPHWWPQEFQRKARIEGC